MSERDEIQIKYAFIFFVIFFFCIWVNVGAAIAWVFGWFYGMVLQRDKADVEKEK